MITQNETKTVYYCQSGAWTDDADVASLAVEFFGFTEFKTIELDVNADVDSEIMGLIPQAVTV